MFDPLKSKMKVFLYAALAFLAGIGMASGLGWTDQATAIPPIENAPQLPAQVVEPARDLSEAFVRVAGVVTPAVVSITVHKVVRATSRTPIDPFGFFAPPGRTDPRIRQSTGSGFLVSSDGYILTNNHVIEDAEQITVVLKDQRSFEATLVGGDPTTDVAVIKVDGSDLPTLSLGDSDDVQVGEWVLAVGNPGFRGGQSASFNHTVTAGIVSFIGRRLDLLQNELRDDPQSAALEIENFAIEDFIQTDAVINPGNSGGPMVNLHGQVIGINSAIASQSGFYQGYGFAIPISLAHRVMEDLIEYRAVRRGFLGVQIRPVQPADAEVYGLPSVSGALIEVVTEGGAAEAAGLRMEDVIVTVDDDPVSSSSQLQQLIARKRPGERARIVFYREGERREVTARLQESAAVAEVTTMASAPERVAEAEERLGIEVIDNSPQLARRNGFRTGDGVLITGITPYGAAHNGGLLPLHLIVAINGDPVESADDVRTILSEIEAGQVITFLLEDPRSGQSRIRNIRMPG